MYILSWLSLLINPLISVPFILTGICKDKKYKKQYALMIGLFFAVFAYYTTSPFEIDLTRYIEELRVLNTLSFSEFIKTSLHIGNLPLAQIWFYIIAKTGNYYLLPVSAIFIVYSVISYMILDFSNRINAKNNKRLAMLFFTLSIFPFASAVSNIRNVVAFTLFTLAIYREFVQKKKNKFTYLLYIIPLFIHISTISVLLIRFFLYFFTRKRNKLILITIFTIIYIYIKQIIILIINIIPSNTPIISEFFNRVILYLTDTGTEYYQSLLIDNQYIRVKIFHLCITLLILFVLYIVTKSNKNILYENSSKIKEFDIYIIIIGLYVLFTIPMVMTVYFRYYFILASISFLAVTKISEIKHKLFRDIISLLFTGISIIGFLLNLFTIYQIFYFNKMFYNIISNFTFEIFLKN